MTISAPQFSSAPGVLPQPALNDGVRFVVEEVDASKAESLLACRPPRQRDIDHGRVNRYAKFMAGGLWMLTTDTIDVAPDATVFDGQHRLLAVIAAYKMNPSMKPVRLRIAYGADPETFRVKDQGKIRTFADLVASDPDQAENIPNKKTVGAAIKLVETYDRVFTPQYDGHWFRLDLSNYEAFLLLPKYIDLVEGVRPAMAVQSKRVGFLTSTLVATHYLFQRAAPEGPYSEFFRSLASGASLAPGDPILTAREWAIKASAPSVRRVQVKGTAVAELHMKVLINTWNNWVRGEPVYRVSWKLDGRMPRVLGLPNKLLAA